MAEKVGVPTVSGLKNGMVSYAVGVAGSLAYGISQRFLGTGLLGGLLGAALAGSVVKGSKGEAIATILGFQSGIGATLGGGILGGTSAASDTRGSI